MLATPLRYFLLLLTVGMLSAKPAQAQFSDTIPSRGYYVGIEQLYQSDYQDAGRTFTSELRGAVKTVDARWIDSICYHTMLGETYFQQGGVQKALEHFDLAMNLYLQYPKWLLQVDFNVAPQVDVTLARRAVPWGVSGRRFTPGKFNSTMKISQGQLNPTEVLQRGGVVRRAQYWQINAVEVLRCTALAMRRRNEILGPLGPYDPVSKDLVRQLARGGAPPNHWSNAWIDVLQGIAHAGVGEHKQAMQKLAQGMLVAGEFDHPLTGVSLLEQGRLMLGAGNAPAEAERLLAEASYSAYLYEDLNVLDEAFRLGHISRLAAGADGVNPAIQPALAWTVRERLDQIASRLNLAMAEDLMDLNDWKNAATALKAGQGRLSREARNGVLANWSMYLQARIEYQTGRDSAPQSLATAVNGRIPMSLQNYQLGIANSMFDSRSLSSRNAVDVYADLLRDPTPADSFYRPLDTLAVMKTPHDASFDRWLLSMIERKDNVGALWVADLAKRRRFHAALPWGGRLAALRYLLATPDDQLSAERRQQQNDLRLRFPGIAQIDAALGRDHQELDRLWKADMTDDELGAAARLWKDYAQAVNGREARLSSIALQRIPADFSFPPVIPIEEMQANLRPGQALVVFHNTPSGMFGFLFSGQASTQWNCGDPSRIEAMVTRYLRDLGNYDGNRELTTEQLVDDAWKKTSRQLFAELFKGSSFDPSATDELVVVPDGALWYVPFESLIAADDAEAQPLVAHTKIRYAPTVGLGFTQPKPWRRVKRTGLATGEMVPGEHDEERAEAIASFASSLDGVQRLEGTPTSAPLAASLLDWLVVLDDIETETPDPLAWAPLALSRTPATLAQWMTLPGSGPQRVMLPGMHTLAERGGKAGRRRSGSAAPGAELFFASCSLMSSGAETALLSRWRVGGQSTLDLVREFAQELPYSTAAGAWQRSVLLARETPVDPLTEMRVKQSRAAQPLTAAHPFFWAGYLVVDSGLPGPQQEVTEDLPQNGQQEAEPDEPVNLQADEALPGAAPPPAEKPAQDAGF